MRNLTMLLGAMSLLSTGCQAGYPGKGYYGAQTRMRCYLYAGQRITYYLRNDSLLRHITLYYELSANDWTSSPSVHCSHFRK